MSNAITTFNMEGYPIGVMLAIGSAKAEMIAEAGDRGCSTDTCLKFWKWEPTRSERGHTAVLPCVRVVIWLRDVDVPASTIAHEAFHAVYGVFPQLGIRLCHATEEVFAYAIENLVRQITEQVQTK